MSDPRAVLAVARAADAAGLDGVFAYDHLFRTGGDGLRRPSLELLATLGGVAGATDRVAVGTLVARATLRPVASLAAALATVARVAPGRLVAALGAGDSHSRAEHETFGLAFGTVEDRVAALRAAVIATRGQGYPVWVGGTGAATRAVAAELADGWNQWGGDVDRFGRSAGALRAAAGRPVACTWGGLVVVDRDDRAAAEKAGRLGAGPDVVVGGPARVADVLRGYGAAGADWVIVGPLDSSDPVNAARLGEEVRPRLLT